MICKQCNKEFFEKYSEWSNGDFCSKSCARKFTNSLVKGTKIVKCITCGKEIEADKRTSPIYCKCDDCKKKKPIKKEKIIILCKNCNIEISRWNNSTGYCLKCYFKLKTKNTYNNYIFRWKQGIENGLQGATKISNYIRKYLFEKYNNKCMRCGWDEINKYTNKIPLEVEHIDGNWKNNKEENLELICPNCHSLTKTYKGGNRGKGRPRKTVSL
jgi:hypothetical protein